MVFVLTVIAGLVPAIQAWTLGTSPKVTVRELYENYT
jgi:hypothetical protein